MSYVSLSPRRSNAALLALAAVVLLFIFGWATLSLFAVV